MLRRTRFLAVLSVALPFLGSVLLLGGCGPDEADLDAYESPPEVRPIEEPPVPPAVRARFALARLLRGPLPRTGRFVIPKHHQLNLEHSIADLLALPDEVLRLVDDSDLAGRVTRDPTGDRNAWHNVLDVLIQLPGVPSHVVDMWERPALDVPDVPLQRRATRALARSRTGTGAGASDDLLLAFLQLRPADREVVPHAVSALVQSSPRHRRVALAAVFQGGSLQSWERTAALLGDAAATIPGTTDALAWWAVLTEGGGPSPVAPTSRNLVATWFPARLLLDSAVWPTTGVGAARAFADGRLLASASVLNAGGILPRAAHELASADLPHWLNLGETAAASARCRLAAAHTPWRLAVQADREGLDPLRRALAEACPEIAVQVGDGDAARSVVEAWLDAAGGLMPGDATGVASALVRISAVDGDEAAEWAGRILGSMPALSPDMGLLDVAYALRAERHHDDAVAQVSAWLLPENDQKAGPALALIRRARDPAYIPAVAAREAAGGPDRPLLRQILIWLHTAPDVPAAQQEAFVRDSYEPWLAAASDADTRGLAPGLLDLGEAGARAYAAGLRGERRPVFIEGLLGRVGLVAPSVGAALLESVDASTPVGERHAVLVAAYRCAPAASAGALAALRSRLAPAARVEIEDVLEVVRHRAER